MRLHYAQRAAGRQPVLLETTSVSRTIYSAWGQACLIGSALAMSISALVLLIVRMNFAQHRSGIYSVVSAELISIAAVLEGALVGYFQWRVLRRVFPTMSSGVWVGATTIAAAGGFVFSWLPTSFALTSALASRIGDNTISPLAMTRVLAVTGTLVGLVWGAAQFAVLRLHVHHGEAWIVASTVAWALGFPVVAFAAFWPDRTVSFGIHILLAAGAGIILGSLFGLLHGPLLLRLRSRLLHADPQSDSRMRTAADVVGG